MPDDPGKRSSTCFSLTTSPCQKVHPMNHSAKTLASVIVVAVLNLVGLSPALATEPSNPISDVVITGNVVSWTGAALHEVVCDPNCAATMPNNVVFLCAPGTPETACTFGPGVQAWGPANGSSSITFSPNSVDLSGGNVFAVRVVFQTSSAITTIPGGLVGGALPTITITETASPVQPGPPAPAAAVSTPSEPAVGMALQAAVGSMVEGTPVSFTGVAMKAGSTYVLQVNSEPVILATGTIAEGGRISGLPRLPALPPGTHTLRLTTTGSDGSSLTIAQVFVVGDDGRFVSISDPAGSVDHVTSATRERLAYTGVQSSVLPWWALTSLLLGLLLVAYSIRAGRMLSRPELAEALRDARTPWEILATPIRVPGIDYTPQASGTSDAPVSLGASIRELDLAISRVIAHQIERFGMPVIGR